MKKSLLLLFFSLSFTQIIAQSSVILPNGNVIPSFTLANRPATNQTVGQLIYQIDGTSGLYVWNGTNQYSALSGNVGVGTNYQVINWIFKVLGISKVVSEVIDSHSSFVGIAPLLKNNYTEYAYLDENDIKSMWQVGKTVVHLISDGQFWRKMN